MDQIKWIHFVIYFLINNYEYITLLNFVLYYDNLNNLNKNQNSIITSTITASDI